MGRTNRHRTVENRPRTAHDGRQAIKELIRTAIPSLPEIGHSTADIGWTAAEFARRSRAPATESAYASDWADFAAWCDSAERLALPADPTTIGAYLSDRSGILKVSTAPTLPFRQRVRAPAREMLPEIKDRGRPTRSSGGRSTG